MEPANNNASKLAYHEVLDDNLEKIVRDFNDFQRMSGASRTGAVPLEDLIDIYITNGGENSPVDLNKPENTVPPHQDQSAHDFNFDEEFHLSDITFDEITVDMNQNDTGSFPDSCPTVNTNSHEGAGGNDSSRVTHIRYGDLKCHGVADRIIGSCSAETVFHSVMKSFRTPGAGRKNLRRQEHMEVNGNKTTSRKYIKRRYKQIIETKEDAAHQMETTTLKNNGAGAKARATRQAHKAYIRSQLFELRQKMNILKLVRFLEGDEKINLPPEPLRRTISDPQQIAFMDNYKQFQLRGTIFVYYDLRVIIVQNI